jgi:hypothetical protein
MHIDHQINKYTIIQFYELFLCIISIIIFSHNLIITEPG